MTESAAADSCERQNDFDCNASWPFVETFGRAGWLGQETGHNTRVVLLPLASELERPLPNWLADRLVGGDGVEPFGLRFVVVSQEVNQTQGLTRSS